MKIIVIGASLGGMKALKTLFAGLPYDLDAALLVVWHTAPESPNLLPAILQRVTSLAMCPAENNQPLQAGRAYIARPDHHLVVKAGSTPDAPGVVCLTRGPKENRFRPSIDVLFRSAAVAFGTNVIGTILTGALDDGASGLYAIKERGGITVVQDPLDAECPNMPINAMRAVEVDHVVTVAEMGKLFLHLASAPVRGAEGEAVNKSMHTEVRIALEENGLKKGVMSLGEPSIYTCPECHGVLMQIQEGNRVRFRCHTGHAYSLDALLVDLTKSTEDTLWSALLAIEECECLLTLLAQHLRDAGEVEAAEACLRRRIDARRRADIIRGATLNSETLSVEKLQPNLPSDAPIY